MNLTPQQCLAERLLGKVAWQSSAEGWCICPGEDLHTHPTSLAHCRVRVAKENGFAPGVYCLHASCGAAVAETCAALRSALGKLEFYGSAGFTSPRVIAPSPPPVPDPVFVPEAAVKFAARVKDEITPEWLASRSPVRPDNRTPASFLHALYNEGEKVLVFDECVSQGQALWEHPGMIYDAQALARFAKGAKAGVWFQTAPVDGEYRLSERGTKSRRSAACVTAWRYLVVESDRCELNSQDWLRVLVRLPVNIVAIYETGGNLPHALVELSPSKTKEEWDAKRDELLPALVTLGADAKTMSAVRLSRLPQCERLGKYDRDGTFHAFAEPRLQRLLYLNPPAEYLPGYLEPWAGDVPIIEKPVNA